MGRYWADAAHIGPVPALFWHIAACLQSEPREHDVYVHGDAGCGGDGAATPDQTHARGHVRKHARGECGRLAADSSFQ